MIFRLKILRKALHESRQHACRQGTMNLKDGKEQWSPQPTLAKLFPSLQTLNLSYSALSNSSLTPEPLGMIILKFPPRKCCTILGLLEAFTGNARSAYSLSPIPVIFQHPFTLIPSSRGTEWTQEIPRWTVLHKNHFESISSMQQLRQISGIRTT